MEALYKIDKNLLKKRIKNHFLYNDPRSNSVLNRKFLSQVLLFANGYVRCLNDMAEDPIHRKEIDTLIFYVCVEYITNELLIKNEKTS